MSVAPTRSIDTKCNFDDFFTSLLNKYYDCMTRQTSDWKKHFDCFDELEQMVDQDIRWPQKRLSITSRNPACKDLLSMQDMIRTLDDVSRAYEVGYKLINKNKATQPELFSKVVFFTRDANDLKRRNMIHKISTRYNLNLISVKGCDRETQEGLASHLSGQSFNPRDATLFNEPLSK